MKAHYIDKLIVLPTISAKRRLKIKRNAGEPVLN